MVTRGSLLLAALLASATSTASANPLDTFGFGSREVALGGAVAADIESGSSAYYNVAGLSRGDELRFAVGYTHVRSDLTIAETPSHTDPVAGINFSIAAPLEIGSTRLAFGLSLHLPDQRISRTRSVLFDRPRWEFYDTRPHKIFLSVGLAFQPTDRVRFGAGITFQSPSSLELNLRGDIDFIAPELSLLEHEFRGNLLSVRYYSAGVQVDAHKRLSLGLAYRGFLRVYMELTAEANGNIVGLGNPIPLYLYLQNEGTSSYFPQELVASVAARPIDSLRLGFDLEWRDWSKHPSLVSSDSVILDLVTPPGLNINLPGEIRGRQAVPLRARDAFIPRIGIEWMPRDDDTMALFVRGGYAFEPAAFPAQTGITNFVDNDRHALSAGFGMELRDLEPSIEGALRLDAHFVYYYLPERVHEKLSGIDVVGDYTSFGQQFGFGLQAEVLFR